MTKVLAFLILTAVFMIAAFVLLIRRSIVLAIACMIVSGIAFTRFLEARGRTRKKIVPPPDDKV